MSDIIDFNAFVLALKELKEEGVFPENVFLSVLGTDPGDHILKLEHAANEQLNSPEMMSKWKAWYEQYGY